MDWERLDSTGVRVLHAMAPFLVLPLLLPLIWIENRWFVGTDLVTAWTTGSAAHAFVCFVFWKNRVDLKGTIRLAAFRGAFVAAVTLAVVGLIRLV